MIFHIEIRGIVQGVGFRPFIYNLALSFNFKGYVVNNGYGVLIVINTLKEKLNQFIKQIKLYSPPLSKIESIDIIDKRSDEIFNDFTIKKSKISNNLSSQIPSDIAMCKECENELNDKNNRRYQYPFISCTNCGPRFSIIKNLPYDRKNTSMDKFKMCKNAKKNMKIQ